MAENETVADILAEMRESGEVAQFWVDRLDAAHKREVDALKQRITELNAEVSAKDEVIKRLNDALAEEQRRKMTTAEKTSSVGNAAKLRDAVKAVVDVGYPHNFQKEAPHIRGYCYDITRAIDKCFDALAAPARECDVGTAEEQSRRFCAFCRPRTETCDGCACLEGSRKGRCEFVWAQMPYEEGGGKWN